ncbi:MAG: ABC transporter substrate-binding protein [Nitrospirota bacterium]
MKTIRIGHLPTIYHTSIILMGTDWINKNIGISVNWQLFGTGLPVIQAFEKGEIDLAYMGLPPVIIGIDRGLHIKCIAGGHVEGSVFVADKDFRRLNQNTDVNEVLIQFKGKTIGTTQKGSMHDVIIRYYIEKVGLEDSVAVKNYPWGDLIVEAMAKGEIDAAVGPPALAVVTEHAFGAKIAIPPYMLWPNNPGYGIVAEEGFIKDNPEIIERFLKLHEYASNFIRTDPISAAKIASRVVGVVDERFVLDTYKISPKYCASISKDYIESTMAFVPVLHRLGYISKILTPQDIFDLQYIRKTHSDPPHY